MESLQELRLTRPNEIEKLLIDDSEVLLISDAKIDKILMAVTDLRKGNGPQPKKKENEDERKDAPPRKGPKDSPNDSFSTSQFNFEKLVDDKDDKPSRTNVRDSQGTAELLGQSQEFLLGSRNHDRGESIFFDSADDTVRNGKAKTG